MKRFASLVWSNVTRPLKMFNLENRAHKVISAEKPKPAPKYESNLKDLEVVLKEHPEIVERLANKDGALEERLKDVYVTSTDPDVPEAVTIERLKRISRRPLPVDRSPVVNFDMGVMEPEKAPPGFITQSNVFKLLAEHRANADLSVAETALRYGITKENVEKIIEYYGAFQVLEEGKKGRKNRLTGLLYEQIESGERKQ